jgi:hypothetical protein
MEIIITKSVIALIALSIAITVTIKTYGKNRDKGN